jgi:recombination protein RecA
MNKSDKLKTLNTEVTKINADLGSNSVITLSDNPDAIPVISTGSLGLDLALGVGGFPRGRIVEIYGPESSGKTTIAIHAIAEAQKAGGVCAFIDVEHAFDAQYAHNLGVDVDDLRISQPDNAEHALEIADRLIATGVVDVVVIDSVAALVPKAELEGNMGDSKMGLHARLMSQALRKLTPIISKTGTLVIFINQLREKIGVMFGNPETTPGGNALKFYASVRLDVRRMTVNKEGEASVSNRTKVKVIKNKVAPPFKIVEFDIVYGEGIDKLEELVTVGVELKVITKGGAWLSYKDFKAQGKAAFKDILKDNPEFAQEIEGQIKEALKK